MACFATTRSVIVVQRRCFTGHYKPAKRTLLGPVLLILKRSVSASKIFLCGDKMGDRFTSVALGPISYGTRQKLGQSLLEWKACGQCTAKPSCTLSPCPWSRIDGCNTFWDLYDLITDAYIPEYLGRRDALSNHEQLVDVVEKIKSRRTTPRRTLWEEIFEADQADGVKPPTVYDQDRDFNMAASLLLLMDLGVLHDAGTCRRKECSMLLGGIMYRPTDSSKKRSPQD